MTQPVSTVAIFCEDVREEKNGQNTIVGTLPDNLAIVGPPLVGAGLPHLPKFACYLRVNVNAQSKPKALSAKVIDAKGTTIAQTEWAQSLIDAAYESSKANKMPLAGFIFKFSSGPFPIVGNGNVKAVVTVDGVEYVAGAVNIQVNPAATASEQPASQSPAAAPASS